MGDTPRFGCTMSGGDVLAIAHHPCAAVAPRRYARLEQACCSFVDVVATEDAEMLSVAVSGPPEAAALPNLLYRLAEPASAAK